MTRYRLTNENQHFLTTRFWN